MMIFYSEVFLMLHSDETLLENKILKCNSDIISSVSIYLTTHHHLFFFQSRRTLSPQKSLILRREDTPSV